MNVETIKIEQLSNDPGNVRRHTERNIEAVTASLRRFGQQIPLVVDQHNIVRVGNCRLDAMKRLGWTECQIVRTTLSGSDLVAYAIADNRSGDPGVGSTFDDDALSEILSALKVEDQALIESAGFTPDEFARLIGTTNGDAVPNDPDSQWNGMPECESEDLTADSSIKINFATPEDRAAFAKLVGQTVTPNTRSIWFPPAPIGRTADLRYADAT